jgi:RNA polymerase sigma-70 factor (ECF subfamily)
VDAALTDRFELEALPYRAELLRRARRHTAMPANAEDLVQQTYLEAWKSFASYQAGTNCRAWLHAILGHCLNRDRRAVRRTAPWPEVEPAAPASPIVDVGLPKAIAQLSTPCRQVLHLIHDEDLAYQEAADVLRIPIGTVMSRLSRARTKLRVILETSHHSRFSVRRGKMSTGMSSARVGNQAA